MVDKTFVSWKPNDIVWYKFHRTINTVNVASLLSQSGLTQMLQNRGQLLVENEGELFLNLPYPELRPSKEMYHEEHFAKSSFVALIYNLTEQQYTEAMYTNIRMPDVIKASRYLQLGIIPELLLNESIDDLSYKTWCQSYFLGKEYFPDSSYLFSLLHCYNDREIGMPEETLNFLIKNKTITDLVKSAKYHSNKFQTSCQKIMKARCTRCLEDIPAYEVTSSNKFGITHTPCCYHFVHRECLSKLYERSARLPPSAELKCNACEGVYSEGTLNLQSTRQNKFFVGPSATCCNYMNRDFLIQDVSKEDHGVSK